MALADTEAMAITLYGGAQTLAFRFAEAPEENDRKARAQRMRDARLDGLSLQG